MDGKAAQDLLNKLSKVKQTIKYLVIVFFPAALSVSVFVLLIGFSMTTALFLGLGLMFLATLYSFFVVFKKR